MTKVKARGDVAARVPPALRRAGSYHVFKEGGNALVTKVRARPRTECSHFHADQVGTTEARELRDGWTYSTTYRCTECGAVFAETHRQHVRGVRD